MAPASSVVGTSVAVVPAATEVVAKETKEVERGGLNSEEHSREFEVTSLETSNWTSSIFQTYWI